MKPAQGFTKTYLLQFHLLVSFFSVTKALVSTPKLSIFGSNYNMAARRRPGRQPGGLLPDSLDSGEGEDGTRRHGTMGETRRINLAVGLLPVVHCCSSRLRTAVCLETCQHFRVQAAFPSMTDDIGHVQRAVVEGGV